MYREMCTHVVQKYYTHMYIYTYTSDGNVYMQYICNIYIHMYIYTHVYIYWYSSVHIDKHCMF